MASGRETKRPPREQETAAERRLRALLDGMLDPVVTIDDHGTILDVSLSVERVFGYAPEELRGTNIKGLMTEPHRSAHDGYLDHYRRTGQTGILGRTREFEVMRKDGETLTCELSVSRVDVPGEDHPVFIGSFRDVTDRRRAEAALVESERRVRAIFDQEVQLVGLVTTDGRLVEVNKAALDLGGVEREEVIGSLFWETPWVVPTEEARAVLRDAVERAAAGEFVRHEAEYIGTDGKRVPVDFSLKPIKDSTGRVVLLLPEARDISYFKETQRRETAMLRALATIGESASILAHEIKNPITAIHLALKAVAEQLGEDHRTVLEELVGRMEKLQQTMRRTLSFTKPLQMEPEPRTPEKLLENVRRGLQPQLEEARIAWEIEAAPDLPKVLADRTLIEEVLTNLVINAVEAMEEGGRLRLAALPAGDQVALEVEDDGPGIAPSLRTQLFKPFVSTKANGTGLGLALCRKIVEEHSGSIDVDRGSLGGARFRILLPRAD